MNVSTVDQINSLQTDGKRKPTPEDLRKVATQFEALLLTQLTSALNKTNESEPEDGEDNMFGSGSGTTMAKQLFSEQLATTMAQSGGVGLSNVILRQLGGLPQNTVPGGLKDLLNTEPSFLPLNQETKAISITKKSFMPVVNSTARAIPLTRADFKGDPNEAEVVSTFEDQMRAEGIDDSMKNLVLDGKIVNTTRARIAPNAPITEILAMKTGTSASPAASIEQVTYQSPVSGRLSSGFGNRFHPIDKKIKFHAGVDLAVPTGTSVEAAARGKVSFAGWSDGYGNMVVIQHPDGRETRYGHMEKLLVSAETEVSAGQAIGLSGSTGKSTGPHVHFEIRENGQVLDPIKILSKGLPHIAER